jgi:REP element-mobilizing transposase RayT
MPFWRLYYHLVWATKNREPLIQPEMEALLYDTFRRKAAELGVQILALNGWVDHVHLVVSIPPKLALAAVVKHFKGTSAYEVNHHDLDLSFGWQRGYGALSLGEQRRPFAEAYVRNQKQHHQDGTTQRALEYASENEEGPAESSAQEA